MKKVTIQDVAKKLNLSRNTVAKALNNCDSVAYETRYLVLEQALKMGYSKLSPGLLSEFNLKKDLEIKTIVVLTRREISMFWNNILMGISDELNKCGCKLQFNFVSEEEERKLALPLDLGDVVDGIIILSVFSKEYTDKIRKKNIPIVFLDAPSNMKDAINYGDVVISEGKNSIREITNSLIKNGAKKIGFIGDTTYCKSIQERYEGYLLALKEAKIPIDNSIIASYHNKHKFYKDFEVLEALESMPYLPDAIVCANDDIALDLVKILNDKGLSVPEDVAITGYDNMEVSSRGEPFLTTVKVANQKLGRRLVQILMWRLENIEFPKEIVYVGVELIYRKSSDKKKCTNS